MHFYISVFCLYFVSSFFFNDTATTEIYTLSLHDALPIWELDHTIERAVLMAEESSVRTRDLGLGTGANGATPLAPVRSEEHTSELQSHSDLVCRLLLEKKKKNKKTNQTPYATRATDDQNS